MPRPEEGLDVGAEGGAAGDEVTQTAADALLQLVEDQLLRAAEALLSPGGMAFLPGAAGLIRGPPRWPNGRCGA